MPDSTAIAVGAYVEVSTIRHRKAITFHGKVVKLSPGHAHVEWTKFTTSGFQVLTSKIALHLCKRTAHAEKGAKADTASAGILVGAMRDNYLERGR